MILKKIGELFQKLKLLRSYHKSLWELADLETFPMSRRTKRQIVNYGMELVIAYNFNLESEPQPEFNEVGIVF